LDLAAATSAEIIDLVRKASNTIHDPCGLAQGAAIGMADMGLIRKVEAIPAEGGRWHVKITIRFTSPGCLYFGYFERRLHEILEDYPKLNLGIEWDDRLDWTPEDLAPSARAQLAAIRRRTTSSNKHHNATGTGESVS